MKLSIEFEPEDIAAIGRLAPSRELEPLELVARLKALAVSRPIEEVAPALVALRDFVDQLRNPEPTEPVAPSIGGSEPEGG